MLLNERFWSRLIVEAPRTASTRLFDVWWALSSSTQKTNYPAHFLQCCAFSTSRNQE